MDISVFLNPVKEEVIEDCHLNHDRQIGNSITIFKNEDDFPSLDGFQVAFVGVEEDRNAVDNEGCKAAPDVIRRALYPLFNHWHDLKIIDLGNVKTGFSADDTYYALEQVFLQLLKYHIVPVFIGGSQDLTYPIYKVYEYTGKFVNITAIDPRFDIGQEKDGLNSESFLSYIILHQPSYLFNYTNIGYQTYYIDIDTIELMKQLMFDIYRLGTIKNRSELSEPLVRNADILTIDVAAFCASDMPGVKRSSPNGFSSEDGCKMTRYAGLSQRLTSIGFFNYNPKYDINNQSANNLAEMIWYFLEGFSLRQDDIPTAKNRDDFKRYTINFEDYDDIIFLCHKTTGKWWMEIPENHFIPCSKDDYDMAMRNELPDRWWQFYQKLM
ncbi:MAG: formimidoylglutamase [Bacteroidales bacterium]|nr:formimidoylglutamase [Bacteroidales bacterium]